MRLAGIFASALLMSLLSHTAFAADTPSFRIAWTIYAGNMPLGYAEETGILDKWGDKYGIDVSAVQLNDYIEAQNQYTSGEFDGVIAITLDALTIPAASGVDSTAAVMLTASNGSDGIVMKGSGKSIEDLTGERINLVQFSGSHYLLARALDKYGMSERDVTVVNTSDADIIAAFQSPETQAVVTWKPQLSQVIEQNPDSTLLFDSADIPDEITDILLVHTETLKEHPELGYALAGAWFEVVSMLEPGHPKRDEVIAHMAAAVGTDRAGFLKQMKTIDFYTREEAAELVTSDEFSSILGEISSFAWDKGLLGPSATSADFIGIEFDDGSTQGNEQNVKLRFPTSYMLEAQR
ncbi:putative urea ABC transporter substrate-binding protein [Marinobacter sp. F3R11]|uniref:putative urea ABC transporter substrate-binding protein n=1 Tax=Marinobacter sp. F3R11 TaxID=2267231 RepID=UPI000DEBFE61|nr:putative urea ABC transporter substrate-binding protein [Marinobacter sp. F3R11]RBW48551.1 nitrate ABC transporter substrate-binding protein [Marinobacter sp. F3R11]